MLILLVEDDPVLRSALNKTLAIKGFDTIQAYNGIDAYRLVQQLGSKIGLLLTDISMPGMDGLSLAERTRLIYPEMQVLLMTGYSNLLKRDSEYVVLRKPFSLDTLLEAVRAATPN
jgi:two-component system cell cycle sensor histidine kinase/response regulator CckA